MDWDNFAQAAHALTPASWHVQAATFLEGIVFLIICFTGMRSRLIKVFPRTVLMAGACGIGMFIAFVGVKVSAWCSSKRGLLCVLIRPSCAVLTASTASKLTKGTAAGHGNHCQCAIPDAPEARQLSALRSWWVTSRCPIALPCSKRLP